MRAGNYYGNPPVDTIELENRPATAIASAGQTTFPAVYTPGYVDVFLNGIKLAIEYFTATDGANIVLVNPCVVNDDIQIVARKQVMVANATIPSGGAVDFAISRRLNLAQGADLASASVVSLDAATGNTVQVTGSVGITQFTLAPGVERTVVFTGAPLLTNSATFVLPAGQNIQIVAGDTAVFVGLSPNICKCVSYSGYATVSNITSNAYSLNGGQLGAFRNKIINGDMQVSQVNGLTAVTPSATDTYPIDQWKVDATQASKLTFQQVVDAPAGFKYSTKVSVAVQTAPAATDRFVIYQPIEGQNIIDLQFGTASAATIAATLWVKGSVAGTYACTVNNVGARSYVGTITLTTGWAKQTVILTADTTGTWATDNTVGVQFGIDLGSGTNFNTTANAWQAGDFTRTAGSVTFVNQVAASTLNFTGVQLEQVSVGTVAGTSFEHVPYATQLSWCQRYLPVFYGFAGVVSPICMALAYSSTVIASLVALPVQTRVPVTGVNYGGSAAYYTFYGISNLVASNLSFSDASTQSVEFGLVVAGATAGQAGRVSMNGTANVMYFTGAQM